MIHCGASYQTVTRSRSLQLQLFKCHSFQESVTARSWLIKGKSPAKGGEKSKKAREKQFPTTAMATHEMVLNLYDLLTEIVIRSQRTATGNTPVLPLHF